MIDDDFFEWRPAEFRYPATVEHSRVALVDGRPPDEVDRPREGGGYDRFRLAQNDDACAIYEHVTVVTG